MAGLTALKAKNAGPGIYPDGGGLYLCVSSSLTRTWVYRFSWRGRRPEMGLGSLEAGVGLANAPLEQFFKTSDNLPRTTEAERLVVQRIGQGIFRGALLKYWDGTCRLTGISDPALLRASHIVPWAECDDDAQRLDVHNGLLLSALWDAAFDAGRVSFADNGEVLIHPCLSPSDRHVLLNNAAPRLDGFTPKHHANLVRHRAKAGFR